MSKATRAGPFFVFAGYSYYPNGGTRDAVGHYATHEEARTVMHSRLKALAEGYRIADDPWGEIAVIDAGEPSGWLQIECAEIQYDTREVVTLKVREEAPDAPR